MESPRAAAVVTPGSSLNPDQLAALVSAHPVVEDCAVVVRKRQDGEPTLVAYVVTSSEAARDRLHAELAALLPADVTLDHCVPVSHVPVTADGRVDEGAIGALPVMDASLVRRWEERWRATPGVADVAVVVEERREPAASSVPGAPVGDAAATAASTAVSAESGNRARALSRGVPIDVAPGTPGMLPAVLERAAREHPGHGVFCLQLDGSETFLSYPELLERSRRVAGGLRARGLRPGDHVIFQLPNAQDFVIAFWACVFGRFVPVPIGAAPSYHEANPTVLKLQHAWRLFDGPLIVTSASLRDAVAGLAGMPDMAGLRAEALEDLARHAPEGPAEGGRPEDVALILLTSGSSGTPKGVTQRHAALLARCAGDVQMNGFTSRDVSLNWFPLDHVGGLVMFHLRDVYCGNVQIQAPTELVLKDPLRWLDWIDRYRATITWAPNFAFGMINAQADELARRRWDLSPMRFILNAGEAIVAKTARRFLELLAPHGLPATCMRPAWGMSETCSAVTYSHHFTRGSTSDADPFVCVGGPIPGFSMRIVNTRDEVVGEGTIGRLQVSGPSVTGGYFRNPTVNAESFTADGWLTTGDLARIDDGELTITGREKDVIIINGLNYYCHEIEAAAEEVPGVDVSYVAACGVRPPGRDTEQIAIFFSVTVPESRRDEVARHVRSAVLRKIGVNPQYLVPVTREDIPKTSIGKIQRAELRQRFSRGEFANVGQLGTAAQETPPGLLHRRSWRRRRLAEHVRGRPATRPLVFVDSSEFGDRLCAALASAGRAPIRVERGERLSRTPGDGYRIDPESREDHQRLLGELAADGGESHDIVYLWGRPRGTRDHATGEALQRAVDDATLGLVRLLAALARHPATWRVLVVSTGSQAVRPTEVVAPEGGAVLGVVRTAAQELPSIVCRHVDVSAASARDAECVARELVSAASDREVAYREGDRYVARIERVPPSTPQGPSGAFERRGLYLLTGGLGGVSVEIARHLIDRYEARVLLVGRTRLPDRATWTTPRPAGDPIADRIAAYQRLEAGGQVRYAAVDVGDAAALKAAVSAACAEWACDLAGVIHQAGVYAERLLSEETADTFRAVLRPKVLGSWALHQVVAEHPGALFVVSSSCLGHFGGFGVAAYAAANAFLDSFTQYQRAACSMKSYSVAWSVWDEVGMSRGYAKRDLTLARGYRALAAPEALEALETAVAREPDHVLVGLDECNRHIHPHLDGVPAALQTLHAYFTAEGAAPTAVPPDTLADDFGVVTRCPGTRVPALPRRPDGRLDEDALHGAGKTSAVSVEPRTDLERVVAAVWCQVLGVAAVGVTDNFFDLGGDSLRIAQIGRRLGEALGRDIALTDLFEHPTISAIAEHLGAGSAPVSGDTDRGGSRGQARRERSARRTRRAGQTDGEERPRNV